MGVRDAVGAFALAAVVAWLATPLSARLARRLGVIHVPRERDLHERPTPGLGGLAILAAVIAAGLVFLPLQREYLGVLALSLIHI